MTIKEYQDKMDELSIELGELQAKKDRIEASKLNDDEMKAALSAVDRKMAAIRSEKFKIEDEYSYQEEQKKEELNKNRDDLIFKNELGSYSKREKIKQEYIKKFPDSELTKDILLADKEIREGKVPSKKIDINELIKALEDSRKKDMKSIDAEEAENDKEQSTHVSNSNANEDSKKSSRLDKMTDKYGVGASALLLAAKKKKDMIDAAKSKDDPLDEEEVVKEEDGSTFISRIKDKIKKHWKKIVAGILIAAALALGISKMNSGKNVSKEDLKPTSDTTTEEPVDEDTNSDDEELVDEGVSINVDDGVYSSASDLVNERNKKTPNQYYRTDDSSVIGYIDEQGKVHSANSYDDIPNDAKGVLTGASGNVTDDGVVTPGEYSGFAPVEENGGSIR